MAAKGILLQSALNHVNSLNLIIRAFTVLKKNTRIKCHPDSSCILLMGQNQRKQVKCTIKGGHE